MNFTYILGKKNKVTYHLDKTGVQFKTYLVALSLLQFKQSFSIQSSPFWFARNYQYDQYPKTESWKEGTDCCL
jgi:hypothetical protein